MVVEQLADRIDVGPPTRGWHKIDVVADCEAGTVVEQVGQSVLVDCGSDELEQRLKGI
jgi:hypothetical protein